MSDLLGITLDQMLASLKSRRVRIPAEIGAYLALEVAEQLMRGPARASGSDVRIAEDGTVSVYAPPGSADEAAAAQSVVEVLASLLVAAGTGIPPILIRLVEDQSPMGEGALVRLRDELESSLVPLNRAAARRVLSRMSREAKRPMTDRPPDRRSTPNLDDALDDLLAPSSTDGVALDPAPMPSRESVRAALQAPPPVQREPERPAREDTPVSPRNPPRVTPVRAPPPAARRPTPIPASIEPVRPEPSHMEEGPTISEANPPSSMPVDDPPMRPRAPAAQPAAPKAQRQRAADLDQFEKAGADPDRPRSGGSLGFVLAFLVILVACAGIVAFLRPDLVDQALGRPPPPPVATGPTPEEQAAVLAAHRARFGLLTVTSEPPEAQVLMFVGRGPAVAEELPPGAAYEFVAIADGHGASRAIVPADAAWEPQPESGPRYELAIQTSEQEIAFGQLDLGPTRLPHELGAPGGDLGSVRVVTSPPGARVYLLIGFTPDVHVENVHTDEAVELLVYHEGYEIERVMVGPSDWVTGADGGRAASLSVTLHERAPAPRGSR
jgi:hypothetical protein